MAVFRLGGVSKYYSIDYFLEDLLWSYAFLKHYIYMLFCREGLLRVTTRVSYTLLYPGLHLAFKPARATPQFDRFREQSFADEFVEPFITAVGVGSYECHIDKLIIQQSR